MTAGAANQIRFVPGRLIVGPTQTYKGGVYPYGGTEIGLARGNTITSIGQEKVVFDELLGEPIDILAHTNEWVFTCFLRGTDDAARELLLGGNYSEGGTSRHGVLTVPGTRSPGQTLGDTANVALTLVPDNLTHADAFMAYRAVPMWDDAAEIAFQRQEEFGIPLKFHLLRGSGGNTLRIGRLADIALT